MEAVESDGNVVAPSGPFDGRTVLVVEDDASVRQVTAALCQSLGFRVVEAESGDQALETLEHFTPDVLFSDITMPGSISGSELAGRARQLYPALPVLLTSGYAKGPFVDGWAVLKKPYDLASLHRAFVEAMSP